LKAAIKMSLRKISADYIFPISSPPIKNGVLIFDEKGKIVDMIDPAKTDLNVEDVQLVSGLLCPGFVNTHCHLELSWMKDRIPEKTGLADFVVHIEKQKKLRNEDEVYEAIFNADLQMRKNGIVAVGDISNTDYSFAAKAGSPIEYYTFIEVYGSMPWLADEKFEKALGIHQQLTGKFGLKGSISPHATYSVSQPLFLKIKAFAEKHQNILSIHHQESEAENRFFKVKSGWIIENMKKIGIDYSWFEATGKSPLESIAALMPADNPILLVHNTFSTEENIDFAQSYFENISWCLCPNANLYIENKLPDVHLFARKNVKITIGTDSLASNHELSILDEIKTLTGAFPEISLEEILKWGTLNGAEFLGMGHKYGSFEKGKTPGINLISLKADLKSKLSQESKLKVIV
jgi:cytosine/adenosine deaminase-related metal-dependent hydrolase